jgi:hypothetical protein
MKRVVIGALLSAVAVFLWGFLYWNVLPLRKSVYQPIPGEARMAEGLRSALPETGVYELPTQLSGESMDAALKRYEAGPIAEIIFLRDGAKPYAPSRFIGGFLHMFLSALLMGSLLLMVLSPRLASYGSRVGVVVIAGLAGALFAHLTYPIWYFHPWNLAMLRFFYDLSCWVVTGLILARFVRPDVNGSRARA